MARKFTSWGGTRISTAKTPQQIVDQLNRSLKSADITHTKNGFRVKPGGTALMAVFNAGGIMSSAAAKRYGIEHNTDTGEFYLNRKGRMNENTSIAAIGGTNG